MGEKPRKGGVTLGGIPALGGGGVEGGSVSTSSPGTHTVSLTYHSTPSSCFYFILFLFYFILLFYFIFSVSWERRRKKRGRRREIPAEWVTFFFKRERGRGEGRWREEETEAEAWICSACLCIHWLLLVCALPGDRTHSLGVWGWHANSLKYPARTRMDDSVETLPQCCDRQAWPHKDTSHFLLPVTDA